MTSRRPQTRSRLRLLAVAVCLIAVSAAAATLIAHASDARVRVTRAVPLGTATVHEGDLIETESYPGQLTYRSLGNLQLSGTGTVTALPHVGQILTEDRPVASVDDAPVGVLFGPSPLYRTLGSADPSGAQFAVQTAHASLLADEAALLGARSPHNTASGAATSPAAVAQAQVNLAEAQGQLLRTQRALEQAQTPEQGADVALVARDMVALGYLSAPTDSWSSALEDAVRSWQDHIGAASTGEIHPDDVLVVRGPSRISAVEGELGASPPAVSFSLSSVSREASFQIKDGLPAALSPGRQARLFAVGSTATGRVTSVEITKQTSVVTIAFDRASPLARTHATRVTLRVTIADERNVLSVPTQALLALASGGYALQLPHGRLLAVRTGAVQHGDIEVSGPGIHAGLTVVSVT